MMKTLLIIAAALVLSATAAAAECDYHKVNAQAGVDQMTTASIPNDEQKAEDIVLLKKTDRVPEDVTVIE